MDFSPKDLNLLEITHVKNQRLVPDIVQIYHLFHHVYYRTDDALTSQSLCLAFHRHLKRSSHVLPIEQMI